MKHPHCSEPRSGVNGTVCMHVLSRHVPNTKHCAQHFLSQALVPPKLMRTVSYIEAGSRITGIAASCISISGVKPPDRHAPTMQLTYLSNTITEFELSSASLMLDRAQ